jgi:hypothetical protein
MSMNTLRRIMWLKLLKSVKSYRGRVMSWMRRSWNRRKSWKRWIIHWAIWRTAIASTAMGSWTKVWLNRMFPIRTDWKINAVLLLRTCSKRRKSYKKWRKSTKRIWDATLRSRIKSFYNIIIIRSKCCITNREIYHSNSIRSPKNLMTSKANYNVHRHQQARNSARRNRRRSTRRSRIHMLPRCNWIFKITRIKHSMHASSNYN